MEQFGQSFLGFMHQLGRETEVWSAWDWVFAGITLIAGLGFSWQFVKFLVSLASRFIFSPLEGLVVRSNLKLAQFFYRDLLASLRLAILFQRHPHRMLANVVANLASALAAVSFGLLVGLVGPPTFAAVASFFLVGWGGLRLISTAQFYTGIYNLPSYVEKEKRRILNLLKISRIAFPNGCPPDFQEVLDDIASDLDQLTEIFCEEESATSQLVQSENDEPS